jgi:16S rRNA processing protein RimM
VPRASSPAPPPEPGDDFIAVGRIRSVHGLRGEILVEALSDNPDRFSPGNTVWSSGRRYQIEAARPHRKALIIKLDSVNTRREAELLRDSLLEVPEQDLPTLDEDEYYRHQVIGLEVRDTSDQILGSVAEVIDTGGNDVYLVRGDRGELLIPAIGDVVKRIDVDARIMTVEVLAGMEWRSIESRRKP